MSTFGLMMNAPPPGPGRELLAVSGRWPGDIAGHVFLIGPWPVPGAPFFLCPGMVHRLDLRPGPDGAIAWQRGLVMTKAMQVMSQLPKEAQEDLNLRLLLGPLPNPANTAVVPIQDGRLLCTFDIARPVEIDPLGLRYLTPVGGVGEWRVAVAGVLEPVIPTSAHPFYDPFERQLYTVNHAGQALGGTSLVRSQLDVDIARWDGEGRVTRWRVAGPQPGQYVHQVAATRSFIVWIDSAVYPREPGERFGLPRQLPQEPYTDVFIARKADLVAGTREVAAQVARLPLEGVHFIADYDDDGEHVSLHLSHAGSTELTTVVGRDDVNHFTGAPADPATLGVFTMLDAGVFGHYRIRAATGEVLGRSLLCAPARLWGQSLLSWDERPRAIGRCRAVYVAYQGFDPKNVTARMVQLYRHHPYRVVPIADLPRAVVPSVLARVELPAAEAADGHELPPGLICGSPTFVPAAGPGAGYVLTVVWGAGTSEIWLYDADRLAQGPRARLPLGRPIPHTLHTAWVPRLARQSRYQVDVAGDIGADHGLLPEPARGLIAGVLARLHP